MTALPPPCAFGLRVKSGWAAVVLLAGPRHAPRVIDRRVLELSDPDVPHSRQPYHAGFGTAQLDTIAIDRLIRGIERFARKRVAALVEMTRQEHRIKGAGIVVPSLTDPATISSPHMRAHASEGRLFRIVSAESLERSRVKTEVILERDVYDHLAKQLHSSVVRVKQRVETLGEAVRPWRAEQKVAAAAAWLILAR
ncbi:MAG TPA: hypothetical protein VG454_17255 [Gemmatimonadales bacterium]|nr:hypothetical protein [Gemmatimonadales bacterium]